MYVLSHKLCLKFGSNHYKTHIKKKKKEMPHKTLGDDTPWKVKLGCSVRGLLVTASYD